jgi:hypothetical protein
MPQHIFQVGGLQDAVLDPKEPKQRPWAEPNSQVAMNDREEMTRQGGIVFFQEELGFRSLSVASSNMRRVLQSGCLCSWWVNHRRRLVSRRWPPQNRERQQLRGEVPMGNVPRTTPTLTVLVVLETASTVGKCNAPFLQALDEFVRDTGIAELSCGLPHLPPADVSVSSRLGVSLWRQPERQELRDGVLRVLIHPCGKQRRR